MKIAKAESGQVAIEDVPAPEPGRDEARVRMSSAGVCHSDLHLAHGDWEGLETSVLLGHEGIGIVEALGEGAERHVAVGDRVILGMGGMNGFWCGACDQCLKGDTQFCAQGDVITGTFAEQCCVWARTLVKIPDSIGDEEAPLACGGLTAFGAIKKLFKHQVGPGRPVAIVGAAGGLGHYGVQIAKAFGFRVVGIDIGEDRLEFIKSLGADLAVSPDDAASAIEHEFGDGVDASIVFSGRLAGLELGMQLLRTGGLFVGVGLPPTSEGTLEIAPFDFFVRNLTMTYSAVGNVQDMRELVDMAAAGKVKSHIGRTGSLSDLPAMFDALEAGKIVGRAVITDLAG